MKKRLIDLMVALGVAAGLSAAGVLRAEDVAEFGTVKAAEVYAGGSRVLRENEAVGTSAYATVAGDVTGTTTGKVAGWYGYPAKGHVSVDGSNLYDIGSAEKPFRDGYFGAGSIHVGAGALSEVKIAAYDVKLTNRVSREGTVLQSVVITNYATNVSSEITGWENAGDVVPHVLRSMAAVTLNGSAWLVGGYYVSGFDWLVRDYVQVVDGVSSGYDTNALPVALGDLCAGVLDGKVYAIGGIDGTFGSRSDVYVFDGGAWAATSSLPSTLARSTASVFSNRIYTIGGQVDGSVSDVVYAFDGATWTTGAPLPAARYNGASAVLNGKLYFIGGENSGAKTDVYEYDGASWSAVASLPAPVSSASAVTLNGRVYLVNGLGEWDAENFTVHVFDGNSWSTNAAFPVSAGGARSVVMNGLIYSFTGVGSYGGTYVSTLATVTNVVVDSVVTNQVLVPDGEAIQTYQGGTGGIVFQVFGDRIALGATPVTEAKILAYDAALIGSGGRFALSWVGATCTVDVVSGDGVYTNRVGEFYPGE